MQLHDLFETLAVNRDQLTDNEVWEILDELTERQSLEISEWIYRHNTGLPGEVVDQLQGIHYWHQQHQKFITQSQRRWLLINTLDNWDRLSMQGRQYIS